ncbi:MAG: hypothetical protein ABDH59_04110 [Fervidobacterium sp.]
MKKVLALSLTLAVVIGMSFELSVLGGIELGGRNRPYIGARIGTLSSGISLMLESYYPLGSFQDVEEINIGEINFLELDPYIYLAFPLFTNLIYVGVAPIIIFDVQNLNFLLYSMELFHVKAGFRFGQGIVFFIEGMTTLTTSFQTLGIYAISAGIGIGF